MRDERLRISDLRLLIAIWAFQREVLIWYFLRLVLNWYYLEKTLNYSHSQVTDFQFNVATNKIRGPESVNLS